MAQCERKRSLGKLVAIGVVTGVGSAFATIAVLRLVGVDLSEAVVGAVAGAVAGTMVTAIAIGNGKGQVAQQAEAADLPSADR